MPAPHRNRKETALVTGASSGIGEALAHRFAAGGCDLVLVARSADKLAALAASLAAEHRARVGVEVADLAQRGAAQGLAAKLKRMRRPVDILVNNAGVNQQGAFVTMAPERHQALIDLNVGALTAMLACLVPAMVARGHGRVLNVASTSSFFPVPTMATYAATKAYVLSLTESLSEELKGTGVSITALCPGVTETAMMSTIQAANAKTRRIPGVLVSDVDDVAAEGFEACMKGEVIRVPGAFNLASTLSGRAIPKWAVRRIAGAIGRRAL